MVGNALLLLSEKNKTTHSALKSAQYHGGDHEKLLLPCPNKTNLIDF